MSASDRDLSWMLTLSGELLVCGTEEAAFSFKEVLVHGLSLPPHLAPLSVCWLHSQASVNHFQVARWLQGLLPSISSLLTTKQVSFLSP